VEILQTAASNTSHHTGLALQALRLKAARNAKCYDLYSLYKNVHQHNRKNNKKMCEQWKDNTTKR